MSGRADAQDLPQIVQSDAAIEAAEKRRQRRGALDAKGGDSGSSAPVSSNSSPSENGSSGSDPDQPSPTKARGGGGVDPPTVSTIRPVDAPAVLVDGEAPYWIVDANDEWLSACSYTSVDQVVGRTLSIIQGPRVGRRAPSSRAASPARCFAPAVRLKALARSTRAPKECASLLCTLTWESETDKRSRPWHCRQTEREVVQQLMTGVRAKAPLVEVVLTNYDALRRPFQNELTVEPVEFGGRSYFLTTCKITLLSERQDMRWRCLQEASEQVDERAKLWDGSGLEAEAVVGRRVSVEGLGVGVCRAVRPARFGSGSAYTLELDGQPGKTTDKKLLHAGGGSAFCVHDEQQDATPWRWSHDPLQPASGLDDLTAQQSAAVPRMRQAVDGLDEEQVDTRTVLRFLRARDFDVVAAAAQWKNMLAWRKRESIDELCKTGLDAPPVCDTVLRLQSLYPHCMCGYDRGGRPVRIECMGRVDVAELYKHCTEAEICRYHVWQQEEVVRRFLPACLNRTGQEHDQVTVVLDMTSARLRDLTRADAREHIKNFITTLSDYYPETLHKMVIVNAPSVLSMAWDFVSPMLDAPTKAKISIAPPGLRTHCVLQELVHPSQLPRFLGGERLTPLDLLLPVVDRGGSMKEVEAAVRGWDGYWGMQMDADSCERSCDFSFGLGVQAEPTGAGTPGKLCDTSEVSEATREAAAERGRTPPERERTRTLPAGPPVAKGSAQRDAQLALLHDRDWTYRCLGLARPTNGHG